LGSAWGTPGPNHKKIDPIHEARSQLFLSSSHPDETMRDQLFSTNREKPMANPVIHQDTRWKAEKERNPTAQINDA
jgi:hypothetical protein